MVDEHPYKVPEVDESKWFTGGHLGSQIQKVNWQVMTFSLQYHSCPFNAGRQTLSGETCRFSPETAFPDGKSRWTTEG